jgi:hypothetical protein
VIADAIRIQRLEALVVDSTVMARPQSAAGITDADVSQAVATAISEWSSIDASAATRLAGVQFEIADLPPEVLGLASDHDQRIWIDLNAAGYGWHVDAGVTGRQGEGVTSSVDLFTVLAHELGHVIGRDHDDAHDVMAATLEPIVVRNAEVGIESELATDRLPKSLHPVHAAFTSLADQTSGVFGRIDSEAEEARLPKSLYAFWAAPSSEADQTSGVFDTSARRLPNSDSDITDAVFARLDERAGLLTDAAADEDDNEDGREGEPHEDALDLWTVLYGLE